MTFKAKLVNIFGDEKVKFKSSNIYISTKTHFLNHNNSVKYKSNTVIWPLAAKGL